MAYTKAGSKAVDKYRKEKYDSFLVRTKKGEKEKISEYAKSKDMSLNAYINDLIEKDMEKCI